MHIEVILPMNKKQIIKTLEMIAIYLEIKGENSFKVSAYRRAAQALETDNRTIDEMEDLSGLKGIGKGTLTVIEELIETGASSLLEELREELPNGLIALLRIPGLGGKKIAKLYQELGVTDIDSLREVCEAKKVQKLAGFGVKTEEKILAALENFGKKPDRLPIAYMLAVAEHIEAQLRNIDGVHKFSRAGSLRRMKELVKDLDFIIATDAVELVCEALLKLENVTEVVASGPTKVSVVLSYEEDVSVDFRIVKQEEFATTLHHFTGSKEHNVKMRQLAKQNGERINEYGIEVLETGEVLTFESEREFFNHFGLTFIPPELREGKEEIDFFQTEQSLIDISDIKGDLHMHSTWSDGANSIEEMVLAARQRGYEFIAITDHSQFLRVANGLTPERLREQREIINQLNEKYPDITILAGVEMDILPDGSLDYDDEVLAELDIVIGAIHSSFSQSKDKIMQRLTNAMKNPHVDIIAHPTGRVIGRRDGYEVDMEQLIQLAKETNTVLELNANPNRLDLAYEWLEKAQEQGVMLAINTDAHVDHTMDFMEVGTNYAKKGFIKKESVINTLTWQELKEILNKKA